MKRLDPFLNDSRSTNFASVAGRGMLLAAILGQRVVRTCSDIVTIQQHSNLWLWLVKLLDHGDIRVQKIISASWALS